MTKLEQLAIKVRAQGKRLGSLEKALAAHPVRRKREPRPRRTDAIIAEQEKLRRGS